MSITYEEDARDVERIEDDCITTLSGLELLGRACANVVDFDDSMRRTIEEAIIRDCPWPTGREGATRSTSYVVRVAALTALWATDDDNLGDPVRNWIRSCPSIVALHRPVINPDHSLMDEIFGAEIVLPHPDKGATARLITGNTDTYARLTVAKGLATSVNGVRCPMTISKALDLAVGDLRQR
ncbi:MAG: hypothetical protein HIU84_13490 [Acidobacteria bacterium]|nr:hypothetical protein [Acidobacteriota bacterium]